MRRRVVIVVHDAEQLQKLIEFVKKYGLCVEIVSER